MRILDNQFFDQPALQLAQDLIGKVLRHRLLMPDGKSVWLAALIIETEAYEMAEKGSHSSLGYTEKRKAMFMAPGTVYMYYARGGDSLNFSARGEGNAVLIKSGYVYFDHLSPATNLDIMQSLNPAPRGIRHPDHLCSGQTLLCKSLSLKVADWDKKQISADGFRLEDTGYRPQTIIQCRRLGIPEGRDQDLANRFVDFKYSKFCTSNPLTKRDWQENRDYFLHLL